MTYDDLITKVGRDRYLRACERARKLAPGLGTRARDHSISGLDDGGASDLAEAMGHLIDETYATAVERVEALLRLYEDCPTYIATVKFRWLLKRQPRRRSEASRRFWSAVRRYLQAEDQMLADPMGYSLWVDWFEDLETSEYAWEQVVANQRDARVLTRVLAKSEPVPWPAKAPLLWQIAKEQPELHDAVADALVFAMLDVCGSCDVAEAERLAESLTPAPESAADIRRMLAAERGITRDANGRKTWPKGDA